ncbi:MAG: NAD(+) diphosphatase [Lachnospiraceae bacterium]|nr:NAD(+) diphosphatase [Lachnospiraceae bacterium]
MFMIQEIVPGLDNAYRPGEMIGDDCVCLAFSGRGSVMAVTGAAGGGSGLDCPVLPTYAQLKEHVTESRYAFRIGARRFFLVKTDDAAPFEYVNLHKFIRGDVSRVTPSGDDLEGRAEKHEGFAALTGHHLYLWYRDVRYCGRCSAELVHSETERAKTCPVCGETFYPRIAPAVIVAVHDGDRLLLTTYRGREYKRFALIAGFAEIGETIEETVRREVMEETGVRIKNICYYKSQPWGMSGDLLMGFTAELDGDPTIRMEEKELASADWYRRDEIEFADDGVSLTGELIRRFKEGAF